MAPIATPDEQAAGSIQPFLIIIAFILGFASWPLFWIAMGEPIL